jgi:hypothetical protein
MPVSTNLHSDTEFLYWVSQWNLFKNGDKVYKLCNNPHYLFPNCGLKFFEDNEIIYVVC